MFHVMKQPSPTNAPVRDIYTVSRLNREAKEYWRAVSAHLD